MKQDLKTSRPESLLQMEKAIAFVLRYGVLLCAILIMTGLLLQFIKAPEQAWLKPAPRTLSEFSQGLEQADPSTIISLGLLLLISLPIVRVGMTAFLFLSEKDYTYLAMALVVFALLLSGLFK